MLGRLPLQFSLPPDDHAQFVYGFGFVPGVLFGDGSLPRPTPSVPAISSIATAMFLHGGWLHLVGNMLYLWIFGNNVEDAMGHGRFVIFYVLCGAAAAMAQAIQDPGSAVPMIGAIDAILGAYLLLYPHARVLVLSPLGSFTQLIRVQAVFVLGFWFVLQLFSSAAQTAGTGSVAYWAHVGGFVAGAALIIVFRKPGFPLLAARRASSPPTGGKAPARRPLGIGGAPTRFADIDRALPLFGVIKVAAVATVEPWTPRGATGCNKATWSSR